MDNQEIKHYQKLNKKLEQFDNKYKKSLSSRKISRLSSKDYIIMLVFFAAYFLVSMINMGSTDVPQTYWETAQSDIIVLQLPNNTQVKEIWCYNGIDKSGGVKKLNVYASDSMSASELKTEDRIKQKTIEDNLYCWFMVYDGGETSVNKNYFAFSCSGGMRINEIVLLDSGRKIINYSIVNDNSIGEHSARYAFDEKNYYPFNSLMTDMYFDEIYHARTAFEHIMGWQPYERTHPPLGKIIISLGIRIFGMNPFGWRISGVIFSAMLSAALYALGKNIFLSRKWAALFALLGCLDGLHFVQGRIATIDTYIVFFSTLAMLFMIKFFRTNILRENTLKSLLPFALSGIFFGLAISSKWTGFYTGAGLLALFIIYIAKMINEYRYKAAILYHDGQDIKGYSKAFNYKLICTLFTGIIFFVIIPFIIYLLSYLPYLTDGNKSLKALFDTMAENQSYMLNYHAKWVVNDEHQCASPWYSWLFNYRSVFMYKADDSFNAYARIHSMGNYMVMWFGAVALIYFIFSKKFGQTKLFLLTGFLSALLPWTLVERTTFIYHFYPAMPYYIGMIIYLLRDICKKNGDVVRSFDNIFIKAKITKGGLFCGVYIALAVLNFILFFPAYTGIPVDYTLASLMFRWLGVFSKHVGL
ncbi:MAG: phospholipid carrier-dependent glycosyltransferase [Clostridia bacterium]|nr:phospholipid carrier-dependent glycosyltransferase [Clostridia bacterium]